MQFEWTTFILEILNFLVLLWILQRFLYKPITAMLEARQLQTKTEINKAQVMLLEADSLRVEYEQKLLDWSLEQDESRRHLGEELLQLRREGLDSLKNSFDVEISKLNAQNQALMVAKQTLLVQEAASNAYSNVSLMLQRITSLDLTLKIVDVLLEDLLQLSDSQRVTLELAVNTPGFDGNVLLLSAHPLDEGTCLRINTALCEVTGKLLFINNKVDDQLIAGVRVIVGECELNANLADELAFFRRQENHV